MCPRIVFRNPDLFHHHGLHLNCFSAQGREATMSDTHKHDIEHAPHVDGRNDAASSGLAFAKPTNPEGPAREWQEIFAKSLRSDSDDHNLHPEGPPQFTSKAQARYRGFNDALLASIRWQVAPANHPESPATEEYRANLLSGMVIKGQELLDDDCKSIKDTLRWEIDWVKNEQKGLEKKLRALVRREAEFEAEERVLEQNLELARRELEKSERKV
ncbi:hypothetical protein P152DRAFT_446728 [Eremomyces bilateralis CBS 781.70]|uniref:Uncharacterized protein n=1 Tax=Eremomyces bilateralis CBS 781.70 TaxID=1392243 RepID=A0A6G1GCV4_9PEZI|nr:uncharacterized protein P152DRAFT_446728 [Eremomyces bilateralis CBS 781.70]KAF1815689.1 hypothetical protein P152DRAFT_446728 [Eremomyces bilateralis CBS 781.70]